METLKTFDIEDNVLIGTKTWNPHIINCINIGDLILKSFKSNPDFIGQVDAETGEENTFQQMKEKSVKCALWMQKSGIQINDVIMVCSHNQLDAYVPFLAALYIGVVVNLLDECLFEEYFLEQIKPKILFIDEKFSVTATVYTNILRILDIPEPTIIIFGTNEQSITLESILNDHYNPVSIDNFTCAKVISMKSTAMKLFTSGTTAPPKAIEIPYSAFMAPSDQHAPNMLQNDIALSFESLGFINGIFMTIQAIFLHVKMIKVKSQFHTERTCKIIEQYKVTWAFLETSMCVQLIKSIDLGKHDLSSLKNVVFSGSTVNSYEIHIVLRAWLPNASILQAYSLTETGIIAYQRQSGKPGSSGYVSQNVCLKIISLNPLNREKSLGLNMQGEICCTSPYMMIHKDDESAAHDNQFNSNWFRTGDMGYYDKDGDIFIIDRINQLFEYQNHQISPTSIETILQNHLAVSEAVVTSIPDNNVMHPLAFVTKIPGIEV
ncbi:luciferin 4-monooxygenase [Lasius niger]|uniref:Luciferin 4-monooxygenase n=1 Tax=Lasius niger TaxID=67767 RepID=A0A0J7K7P0_LASNI|nr:luciferin 4-monooxygenase [Lasius niger]